MAWLCGYWRHTATTQRSNWQPAVAFAWFVGNRWQRRRNCLSVILCGGTQLTSGRSPEVVPFCHYVVSEGALFVVQHCALIACVLCLFSAGWTGLRHCAPCCSPRLYSCCCAGSASVFCTVCVCVNLPFACRGAAADIAVPPYLSAPRRLPHGTAAVTRTLLVWQ